MAGSRSTAAPTSSQRAASRPRKLPPAERRAELVAAAEDLLLGKGIERTSVADITAAAGVAKGTFYLYFDSKDAIVNAVAESWGQRWMVAARAVVARRDLDPLEKLVAAFASRSDAGGGPAEARGELYRHIHRPENRQFHDALARVFSRELADLLAGVIADGVRRGLFDTTYPAEGALWAVSMFVGADLLLDPVSPDYDPTRWSGSYLDFALRGLGCSASEDRVRDVVRRLAGVELPGTWSWTGPA